MNTSLLCSPLPWVLWLKAGSSLFVFLHLLHVFGCSLLERWLDGFSQRYEPLLGIYLGLHTSSILLMNILEVICFAWSRPKRRGGPIKASGVDGGFVIEIAHRLVHARSFLIPWIVKFKLRLGGVRCWFLWARIVIIGQVTAGEDIGQLYVFGLRLG